MLCYNSPNMAKEKILVVGGGFGGVKAALELAEDHHFHITLISDQTELRYYPTLYRTATGGSYANSSIPLERIFEDKAVKLVHATASTIDRKAKILTTADGATFQYDTLIVGLGVVTNYFGIEGMQEFSYSIKSQAEIARFKARVHSQLRDTGKLDSHYVIVGAGPTGIELAGALPEYLTYLMKKYGIKGARPRIDLIEAAPRLLPRLPRRMSMAVKRRLKSLGVKVHTKCAVQGINEQELLVNGRPIKSGTVVWTAGITNHPFFKENAFILMERGKVAVDVYLQAFDNIFVIGDNANTPYSGLAQTALHDGAFVAENLRRRAAGKSFKSYKVKAPVTVIPAGPYWAAVQWGKVNINGRLGWLFREAADIIGFRDVLPWSKAAQQYMTTFDHEEDPLPATATPPVQ